MNLFSFFIKSEPIAVVGASKDGFGYKVYKDLKGAGFKVFPVNPKYDKVLGDRCYPSLKDLPSVPHAIDIITPPSVTAGIVTEALKLGIKNIWMQPGAESKEAIELAKDVNLVHNRCIMVERRLGKHKDPYKEIIEHLEEYDEGTLPPSSKDAMCCGEH